MEFRRGRLLAAAGLMAIAAALCCPLARAAAAEGRPAIVSARPVTISEFLGVNTLAAFPPPQQYRHDIELVRKLGLKWIRIGMHWYLIEPTKDHLDLAGLDAIVAIHRKAGMKTLGWMVGPPADRSSAPPGQRPDQYPPRSYEDYAERLAFFAKRYPNVEAWQIWNEPNLRAFWQPADQPLEYHRLVETVSRRLRELTPRPTLVLGGMAYYSAMTHGGLMFEELAKLGTFKFVDAVAYHPYLATPLGDPDPKHPYNFITNAAWLNDALRKRGAKAIWATEWGWASYRDRRESPLQVSEQKQANFILERLTLLMALGFDKCFYFMLYDLPSSVGLPDRAYGLLRIDGSPKPAYTALANFLKITGDRLSPTSPPRSDQQDKFWSFAWKREDGRTLWFVWSDDKVDVTLKGVASVTLADPLTGNRRTLYSHDNAIKVPVTDHLQIVELGREEP
jgi:beta-xylosidase